MLRLPTTTIGFRFKVTVVSSSKRLSGIYRLGQRRDQLKKVAAEPTASMANECQHGKRTIRSEAVKLLGSASVGRNIAIPDQHYRMGQLAVLPETEFFRVSPLAENGTGPNSFSGAS
jgi:hypothetical protein